MNEFYRKYKIIFTCLGITGSIVIVIETIIDGRFWTIFGAVLLLTVNIWVMYSDLIDRIKNLSGELEDEENEDYELGEVVSKAYLKATKELKEKENK